MKHTEEPYVVNKLIPVREIFGPTIQGEGLHTGRLATFVRVAGCDSQCEWCDTKYAWGVDDPLVHKLSTEQIAESIMRRISLHKLVVLTGGNPCLYDFGALIDMLHENAYEVHVETQGTLFPEWLEKADFISLSPKVKLTELSFYGMAKAKVEVKQMIDRIKFCKHQLKFVIGNPDEYALALEIAKSNPREIVIFQPKYIPGDSSKSDENGIACLADEICSDTKVPSNVRFMPQLHRIIWGDLNGV